MQSARAIIDALLPPGSLWSPEDGEGLDQLLDGIAANYDSIISVLKNLAYVRNPMRTALLADLEREFGIVPNDVIAEATRRARLSAAKTARNGSGSSSFIQSSLMQAGFDVHVYDNNPPVNPASLSWAGAYVGMGDPDAYFGNAEFEPRIVEGLIVNGPLSYNQTLVNYTLPTNAGYWPLVSFVGGNVVRDDAGHITSISTAHVPFSRKQEFIRMLIRLKPLHEWIIAQVQYV